MCEAAQVLPEHADAQGRPDPVAGVDELLRLVVQAQVPGTAGQLVDQTRDLRKRGAGSAQMGQGLLEATGAQQRQAVNGSVKAREAVEWAHAQRLAGLRDGLLEGP